MEENYKKAIEQAKLLADRILNDPSEEYVKEYRLRKVQISRLNIDRKWINFWLKVNYRKVVSISAAAAMIAVVGTLLLNFNKDDFENTVVQNHISLMPAKGSVVLKLASGEFVELDSAAIENKLTGVKVDPLKGVISYFDASFKSDPFNSDKVLKPEYNELSIPKGRSYSVVLSDGTRVWLNAMSKLYYPVTFNGDERRVKIEGEAFFDVKRDEKRPFIVETSAYSIKVLGTKFNVNAYQEERVVSTTLVSGLIEIPSGNSQVVKVTPGKQFQMDKESKSINLEDVDTELYTSWMNDVLSIRDTRLSDILNIIKRRYDVDIVINDNNALEERFTGKVPLNENLSIILEQLEKVSDVRFVLKDGKLVVKNK